MKRKALLLLAGFFGALPLRAGEAAGLASAREFLSGGDARAAETAARRVLKAQGPSAGAYALLGEAATSQKRYARARRWYRRALKRDARCAPAYWGLGQIQEKRGRLDEAANEYRAAILSDPEYAAATEALARLKAQTVSTE